MGKRKRLFRCAALGALVAGVVLAFAVPSIALAATASFSKYVPAPGSSSTNAKPTISVVVYDRYGVRYMRNMLMSLDGVRVTPRWTPLTKFTRFRLTYSVPTPLSVGSHTVKIFIRDRKGKISRTSWSFHVTSSDVIPPTTMSNALSDYDGPAIILLFASDNAGGSGVAHTYFILDGGPVVAGTAAFTAVVGSHTLEFWSVDAAGNVETHHTVDFIVTAPTTEDDHAAPANSCTAVGCHGGLDLATIHWASKCTPCHAPDVTPAHDCTLSRCHGELVHAEHTVISSSSTPACTQATCHGTNVVAIHVNCAQCHASDDETVLDAIAAGGATCETCHTSTAAAHAAIGTGHTVSGICYTSLCHAATDVSVIHTRGDDPPGCAACHAPGVTPSTTCGTCHPDLATIHGFVHVNASGTKSSGCTACHGTDIPTAHNGVFTGQENLGCFCHTGSRFDMSGEMAPLLAAGTAECVDCHPDPMDPDATYPYHVGAHDALIANLDTGTSKACTACHGDDVNAVGSRLTAYGTVHVPAVITDPVQEHKSCSCHTYHEVTVGGGQVCADCHGGEYGAIHGWKVSEGSPSPKVLGLWNVSGHNTDTFGTVGAQTDFSTLGITDTVGGAPTITMPLTVNNTFKSGWSWTSTVTCEDCHTGLVPGEVAGPHGGQTFANWGIDPAYSGSFETASLWGKALPFPIKNAAGTTVSTITIGPFAEGIAQYASGNGTEELAEYQITVPADNGVATDKSLVAGPAIVSNGTVICVKCHDLYNAGTGINGWANYGHEHHAADNGAVGNFGKYDVGDGGTMSTVTVVAESATAAMAKVPGATLNKQIVKESLGREDAGACRNCHIAVPHGWKRPKLIVYSNLDPNTAGRTALGLPATGDSAPYNIGPAVYEGEGLFGTAVGSGQMNGLSSKGHVEYSAPDQPTQPDLSAFTATVWSGPYLTGSGSGQYVNWSSADCNACGHHVGTKFDGSTTAPAHSTRSPYAWGYTTYSNGAWK
jgi:hypothetical protein